MRGKVYKVRLHYFVDAREKFNSQLTIRGNQNPAETFFDGMLELFKNGLKLSDIIRCF